MTTVREHAPSLDVAPGSPLLSPADEAGLVALLARDPTFAAEVLPQLDAVLLQDRVAQVCVAAMAGLSDSHRSADVILARTAAICTWRDPVRDLISTARVYLFLGIDAARMSEPGNLVLANSTATAAHAAPAWLQAAALMSLTLPNLDPVAEPGDVAWMDLLRRTVRGALHRYRVHQAQRAASLLAQPSTAGGSGDGLYRRVEEAARPFFLELAARQLPEGVLERGGEYRCRNTHRGDASPGMRVHVGDDEALGLWTDGHHGKGRGIVSLYAYLLRVPTWQVVRQLALALGVIPGGAPTDPHFAAPAGTRPLPLSVTAPFDGDHILVEDAPAIAVLAVDKLGSPVCAWPYRDHFGHVFAVAARYQTPQGTKECRPWTAWRRRGDGEMIWRCCLPAGPLPLFNADRLAARARDPVLLVEGEKCASAAERILPSKWLASTWMLGARGVGRAEVAPLAGRTVVIWPDADHDGVEAARALASKIAGLATEVVLLSPGLIRAQRCCDLPDGWDIADAVAEGWTAERVAELMASGIQVSRCQKVQVPSAL